MLFATIIIPYEKQKSNPFSLFSLPFSPTFLHF